MARILQYIRVEFDGAPVIRALTIRFPCLFAGLRATRSQLPEITRQVFCCRIGRDERQGLKIIEVLRLVGATDQYIASAFVRKLANQAFFGSLLGSSLASLTLFLLPSESDQAAILTGLRLEGMEWIWLGIVPLSFSFLTFLTTRISSLSILRTLT